MLKLEVPHTLSRDDAKQRVDSVARYWASKYGVQVSWTGYRAKLSGKVLGIQIDANLEITDKKVEGEATDPGILFRNKARQYITQKLLTALDPSKAPADAASRG